MSDLVERLDAIPVKHTGMQIGTRDRRTPVAGRLPDPSSQRAGSRR